MKACAQSADKILSRVLHTADFFYSGGVRLVGDGSLVKWDENIPTACTDGAGIRWNPAWFEKVTWENPQVAVMVMVEEIGHCLLGHLWRHPPEARESPEAWFHWNMCADQEVRWLMREFSELQKAKGLGDPYPFPSDMSAECLPQDQNRGKSAEQIWRETWHKGKGGKSGGKGGKSAPKGKLGPGNGIPAPGPGSGQIGEIELPKAGDPAEQEKAQRDWESELQRAARSQGSLPASIKRVIGEIVSPRVPWWEILRSFLRENAQDDWDMMRPDLPLSDSSGFICPGLHSERCGPMVFAKDTSGSIDPDLLNRFVAEQQYCLDDVKPSRLLDICCDAAIQSVHEYTPGDTVAKETSGGGGTDFRPVFDHVANDTPRCLVYLTDMMGAFPDADPGYPVIWLNFGPRDTVAPFGETVYVGD